MRTTKSTFIDGEWRDGRGQAVVEVDNASDGSLMARFAAAGAEDVADAVSAARRAWADWADRPVSERTGLVRRAADILEKRVEAIAETAALEIGTPLQVGRRAHGDLAAAAMRDCAAQAERFDYEERVGNSLVVREPAGVAAAITAWNYPVYQLCTKLVPAVAAGCTAVAKPSEVAPLTTVIFFEALEEAGLPPGVANLVIGTGPEAGEALASHPDVDVVSFTGSTRTGVRIAELAAPGVKHLTLELGGKSACIVLEDADLDTVAGRLLFGWLGNSGQTCAALTRLLVPRSRLAEAEEAVREAVSKVSVGHPLDDGVLVGPLVSRSQRERVASHIRSGLDEGARLLVGGPDQPPGLQDGHYVAPTVFTDVTPHMTIAQDEIFGPVLCIIAFDSEDDAVEIANGTDYGLSGAVWSADAERAMRVARRLRTGQVSVNGGGFNIAAPFGGYKKSGYGREGGRFGFEEYLRTKAVQL